ncbi:uncharacterized protein LOC141899883 [Tubulanus polymorphus]|uniref:uncharacterized protein LOC141899883 n=1 Tax=Tubulanus polymorphus TaxID=672921 RepID=UPI003DA69D8E
MVDKDLNHDQKLCLWHPEILSTEGIVQLLSQRRIPVPVSTTNNRDELMNVFRDNVLPLPQRLSSRPKNCHGQLLTRKQIEINRKRLKNGEEDESPLLKRARLNQTQLKVVSPSASSHHHTVETHKHCRTDSSVNMDEIVIKKFNFKRHADDEGDKHSKGVVNNTASKQMKLSRPSSDFTRGYRNSTDTHSQPQLHNSNSMTRGPQIDFLNRHFESCHLKKADEYAISVNSSEGEPCKKPKLSRICWP